MPGSAGRQERAIVVAIVGIPDHLAGDAGRLRGIDMGANLRHTVLGQARQREVMEPRPEIGLVAGDVGIPGFKAYRYRLDS